MMSIAYWNINKNIVAGTTLRHGGFSVAPFDSNNMAFYVGDNYEHVLKNRQQLAAEINIPLSHWVIPKITHSSNIVKVTKQDIGKGSLREDGSLMNVDALYTDLDNVLLGVFHADCIPILLYDPTTNLIGAIHTGWVGNLNKLTSKFINHWVTYDHVIPKNIHVYVGPSLSQSNFQVKEDVISQFQVKAPEFEKYLKKESTTHTFLDGVGMCLNQLIDANIPRANITINHACTYSNSSLFFSYRKEKATGRHLSFIAQTKQR